MVVWLLEKPAVESRRLQRELLAQHLGCPAEAIDLHAGPEGKPGPRWVEADRDQNFPGCNSSTSWPLWAYGIDDSSQAIGVDIEAVGSHPRPLAKLQTVANHFFSVTDRDWLATQSDYRLGFLYLWTRKEALVKALGTNIAQYAAIDVLTPDEWLITSWLLDGPQLAAAPWRHQGYLSIAQPRGAAPQFDFRFRI